MTVVKHYAEDEILLATAMALCSDAEVETKISAMGEPTECALVNYTSSLSINFSRQIEHYSVYARLQPEHKVRIVNTWKNKGMITAMTGDGVNDAPSIKSVDIGIGMGITGTDVTKNVADMVLAIFISTLLGFVILKPVHLLWINLITDCFPALALGMETPEDDIMKRKPRNPKDGITMAFLTMSMTEIFHSFNLRSRDKSIIALKNRNLYLLGAMLLSLILTTAVIYVLFLSDAFGFTHISPAEYVIALALSFQIIPIVETVKTMRRWRRH